MKKLFLFAFTATLLFSCNSTTESTQETKLAEEKKEVVAQPVEETKTEPILEIVSGTVMSSGKPKCGCKSSITLKTKSGKVVTCLDKMEGDCIVGGEQPIFPAEGDKLTLEGKFETSTCEDGSTLEILNVSKCTVDQIMF